MSDRVAFQTLSDRVILDSSVTFNVINFQHALKNQLYRNHHGRDFWTVVIREASANRATLSNDQRPHLKQWMKENWYWLFEDSAEPKFSAREKYYVALRFQELDYGNPRG